MTYVGATGRRGPVIAALACFVHSATGLGAAEPQPNPGCTFNTSTYDGSSTRVRREEVGGREIYVVLPADYETNLRSYPVVYLLHGGLNSPEAYLAETDLIEFTAQRPDDERAIVVLPDGNLADVWVDWRNGAFRDETLFLDEIVPHVESTYRVTRGGAYRAIAGFSGGAFAAMQLASRHPQEFAAAASFSGLLQADPTGPGTAPGGAAIIYVVSACYGSPLDPFAIFGDPLSEPIPIRNHNPTTLARNLRGLSVAVFSGNGVPCDVEDALIGLHVPTSFFGYVETGVREQALQYRAALIEAGVPHRFSAYACGVHSYRHVEKFLHAWWPQMISALGRPAPETFDFRSADPRFSAWGWTFEADAERAAEFLDVTDACSAGVKLGGSGITRIVTAPLFDPGALVTLHGAVDDAVAADALGRITFTVDLGPPHQHEQYTFEARIAGQDRPDYFTTRQVSFEVSEEGT